MRSSFGWLLASAAFVAAAALADPPPPVIRELGAVVPTPVPTRSKEERIRLITSLTVQNRPDGPSIISFEATDFAKGKTRKGDKIKYRILASELYTLTEPKPEAKQLANEIYGKIRDLEKDLQKFVEITGPPRVREPVTELGIPQGQH